MKSQIALFTAAILMVGCSSVSESIPTVKIEKRKQKATVQSASYETPSPSTNNFLIGNSTSSSQLPKEAATVCETDQMRNKVVDGDDSNDLVRLMVVQDSDGSSQLLSEIEINCRDYFLRKTIQSSGPSIIQASSSKTISEPETRRINLNSRYTYIVHRGDTVWGIAREHCTTVKAISRLNGLGRGNVIDVGQRLKMPDEGC